MAYWIASLVLLAFGVVAMFSIGRPFLLVGLAMLVLGPLRKRPVFFWPPFAAVVAWNVAFMAIAPSVCTATQTIGAVDQGGGSGESSTVCTSLTGITYRGSGIYNPSLEPANQAALLAAGVTFVLILVVAIALRPCRTDRRSGMKRDGRGPARVAGAIGAVWDVAYLIILNGQIAELGANGAFYAGFVGVMSALCLLSTLARLGPRLAQLMRYAAAPGLVLAGALGAASIGLPLVLAGLLSLASAGPRQVSIRAGAAAGAVSTLVFVAGVALTWPNTSP